MSLATNAIGRLQFLTIIQPYQGFPAAAETRSCKVGHHIRSILTFSPHDRFSGSRSNRMSVSSELGFSISAVRNARFVSTRAYYSKLVQVKPSMPTIPLYENAEIVCVGRYSAPK